MKLSIVIAGLFILFYSCKKERANTEVRVRVENATTETFGSFILKDSEFGIIQPGDTSTYQQLSQVLPVPFANIITVNNTSTHIVDIIKMDFLQSGNYLLKVLPDSLPWRYKAKFIKE